MTYRQLVLFAEHVLALIVGAATPTLTRIADVGIAHLTGHDLSSLGNAELAVLIVAAVAWATPITRQYGVGALPPGAAVEIPVNVPVTPAPAIPPPAVVQVAAPTAVPAAAAGVF